ncbi:MAG: hypothetical protein HQK54_11570 [Oligoflexales bacterium]|nr:hypothetical protein [Oligoflexales bacterium]
MRQNIFIFKTIRRKFLFRDMIETNQFAAPPGDNAAFDDRFIGTHTIIFFIRHPGLLNLKNSSASVGKYDDPLLSISLALYSY